MFNTLCWLVYCNPCQDLRLLDNNLTTARLLQIITAESPDPSNLSSCLDLEVQLKDLHSSTFSVYSLFPLFHFCCCPTPSASDNFPGVFRGSSGLCWGEVSAGFWRPGREPVARHWGQERSTWGCGGQREHLADDKQPFPVGQILSRASHDLCTPFSLYVKSVVNSAYINW